jgi:hypothetical protein
VAVNDDHDVTGGSADGHVPAGAGKLLCVMEQMKIGMPLEMAADDIAGGVGRASLADQDLETIPGVVLVQELFEEPADEPFLVAHGHDH